ncbi:MFS transporter [Bradyrhizobium sp. 2TAF24]|uniref:MFS transporter n=1 Tax=Bradyrhizobium sp. 2TAF24 TaxID=3233011 RepID=UPI003F8E9C5A
MHRNSQSQTTEDLRLDIRGLTALLCGVFLAVSSAFIVNVALPGIRRDFEATAAHVSAVVACYGLAYAMMLITGGRLGDLYGRRRLFIVGLAGFSATSLMCGLAPTIGSLIAARIGQGLFAALMYPQVLSIIRVAAADELARTRGFAAFGVTLGLSGIAGPLIGGALITTDILGFGWRMIFLAVVPVGVITCATAWRFIPETRDATASELDISGALLCTAALGLLLYPLIAGPTLGWPRWTVAMLAAGIALLGIAGHDQRRKSRAGGSPLIALALFTNTAFTAGTIIAGLLHATLVGFLFVLTLHLQTGLGCTPWQAALFTAPTPAAFLVTSVVASRLAARLDAGVTMMFGAVGMAVGYAACAAVTMMQTAAAAWTLVPALAIVGAGQGLLLPQLLNVSLGSVSRTQAGSASGLIATAQQIGGAFGVAAAGILYFGLSRPTAGAADHASAFALSLASDVVVSAIIIGLLPILSSGLSASARPSR